MRAVDMTTYLADCLMPKVDVATMAHALEARAPLLDHRILEFGLALPDEWLRGSSGAKTILRAVLDRYVDRNLFDRPKQGFDMPVSEWFSGQLRTRLIRMAEDAPLLDTGWFSPDALRQMIDEHGTGTRDHGLRLYNLLFLNEWLQSR
jgi:asparagine synthase (glutamine-hydrolysing)